MVHDPWAEDLSGGLGCFLSSFILYVQSLVVDIHRG